MRHNLSPPHSQSAFLEVVIPPDIISEETSNDMMVPEGGAAKLVCKARGYPKPDIVWKREDGTEIISRAGPGKTKSKDFKLYFAPVNLAHAYPLGAIRRRAAILKLSSNARLSAQLKLIPPE